MVITLLESAREQASAILDAADKAQHILAQLPEELQAKASIVHAYKTRVILQFSLCSPSQAERIRFIVGTDWDVDENTVNRSADFTATIDGLPVLIHNVPFSAITATPQDFSDIDAFLVRFGSEYAQGSSPITADSKLKVLPMSPDGFVRMCASAGYTLAQGGVCARSASQVVPDRYDLLKAAQQQAKLAMDAGNIAGHVAFTRLAVEAATDLQGGAI